MEKVSVIIPVYNGAQHIGNVFKYLSEQTYKDFETIFVVDQKTTDRTLDEINEHKGMLREVTVAIQTDAGKLGGARNIGIDKSSGEILWFLDVDDRPMPDFISDTVRIMNENNADVVMCNYIRSFSLETDGIPDKEYNVVIMDRDASLKARLREKVPVTAWSRIMTKRLIIDNGIRFSHGYAEDVEFTYNILSYSKVVCYYEKPLYIYYQNQGSICNKGDSDNARGRAEIEVYGRLEEFFKDDRYFYPIFKKGSAKMRMRSAVHMDKANFIEYSKSNECRNMIRNNLNMFSPEVIVFKAFPKVYYRGIRWFLDNIFYRDGRWYTKVK